MARQISIVDALRFAWQTTLHHFWLILGILATFGIVSCAGWVILAFGLLKTFFIGISTPEFQTIVATEHFFINPWTSALYAVVMVLLGLVTLVLRIGTLKVGLALYNYDRAQYSHLFSGAYYFARYMAAFFLFSLICGAGLVLFVIPGIVWGLTYYFFGLALVDKDCSVMEALRFSQKITYGYRKDLFLLLIVLALLNSLGSLLFGVGLLFTVPMSHLALVYMYKQLVYIHGQ